MKNCVVLKIALMLIQFMELAQHLTLFHMGRVMKI